MRLQIATAEVVAIQQDLAILIKAIANALTPFAINPCIQIASVELIVVKLSVMLAQDNFSHNRAYIRPVTTSC